MNSDAYRAPVAPPVPPPLTAERIGLGQIAKAGERLRDARRRYADAHKASEIAYDELTAAQAAYAKATNDYVNEEESK
jgi:hypothetical protein